MDQSSLQRIRARLFAGVMAITFVLFRLWLWFSPDTDLFIAGYNIHHLYTGLLLIAGGGVPLAVVPSNSRFTWVFISLFAVGLAMALDEFVYLIATDGSNASYLLPISFWGGLTLVLLACLYALLLGRLKSKG